MNRINPNVPALNKDLDMITTMELDLVSRARLAMETERVTGLIQGIFSLDDLESQRASDIVSRNKMAVGIGYVGAENRKASPSQSDNNGRAAAFLDFRYMVILAVPSGPRCTERYNATKLLTVLRNGIFGATPDPRQVQRSWVFEKEYPVTNESTDTLLYYAQVWKMPIPVSGN